MVKRSLFRSRKNSVGPKVCPIQVSLDIHEDSTRIFVLDMSTGVILKDINMQGHYKKALGHMQNLGKPEDTMVIYEAGCHGFSPYRFFTKKQYCCKVIAPCSIPKRPGDQKTDRDDAIHNMYYHNAGLLRYVTVPTEEDEDMRECLRYRQQSMWEQCREKQKIQSLVKRWGLKFNETRTCWTKAHYHWLRTVQLSVGARTVLDSRLKVLTECQTRITSIDETLDSRMIQNERYAFLMGVYQAVVGIGRIGAMTIILEGGDLSRFYHPMAMMKFSGLIPGKRSSGKRDPAIHITKAGNKYLRTALVGAAKYYGDSRLLFSEKKKKKVPEQLKEFNTKCQTRLHTKYCTMKRNGKKTNVVRVAVARELCGFIWSLANEFLPAINPAQPRAAA